MVMAATVKTRWSDESDQRGGRLEEASYAPAVAVARLMLKSGDPAREVGNGDSCEIEDVPLLPSLVDD